MEAYQDLINADVPAPRLFWKRMPRRPAVHQINNADSMSDSPPIASGLPHCRFPGGDYNSQWYAAYCIVDA